MKVAVTIDFEHSNIKLESSEAYLLKLGKNMSWDFEVIYIFRKNAVLKICRDLRGFYTYKKINNIFLRIPKLIEIG